MEIQNGRHFWWDKIFLKIGSAILQIYPVGKNFVEIALPSTVFEREAFLCLQFLRKIQNGHHFWWDKKILKIGSATEQGYPVGQKFCSF